MFERLAEGPLLPFRYHKLARDRHRLSLDLDDDLNTAIGRRRSRARGTEARSGRLGCYLVRLGRYLVQRDPNLLKLLVLLLLVVWHRFDPRRLAGKGRHIIAPFHS